MQTDGEAVYQRFTPFDEVASPNKRFDCVFFDFVTRKKRNIHVGLESQVQSFWGRSLFLFIVRGGRGGFHQPGYRYPLQWQCDNSLCHISCLSRDYREVESYNELKLGCVRHEPSTMYGAFHYRIIWFRIRYADWAAAR